MSYSIYFFSDTQLHGTKKRPSSNPRWYLFHYSEPSTRDISSCCSPFWNWCPTFLQLPPKSHGCVFMTMRSGDARTWTRMWPRILGGRIWGGPKVSVDCCICGWRQSHTREIDRMTAWNFSSDSVVDMLCFLCTYIIIPVHVYFRSRNADFNVLWGLKWGHAGRGLPWGNGFSVWNEQFDIGM